MNLLFSRFDDYHPPSLTDNLAADVADELAAMALLNDEALWAASQPSVSPAQQRRLRQLNASAQTRDLTDAERAEQAALVEAYHRSALRRARALVLLAQRGHAITPDTTARDALNG